MTTTTIVAICAALAAFAGLGWQVYTWRAQHQTRVRVRKRHGVMLLPLGTLPMLVVEAINLSGHPVHVRSVGFLTPDEQQELHIIKPLRGATLPGVIGPRNEGEAFADADQLRRDGYNLDSLKAFVRLATGERIVSKRR